MRIGFISVAILLITIQLLAALPVKSQKISKVEVTMGLTGEPLLTALKEIEQQTPFRFVYRKEELGAVPSRNIGVSTYTVKRALDLLLENTNLSYKQLGNNVLILPKEASHFVEATTTSSFTLADIPIKGTVTDAAGEALPGVSVKIKGATTGTTTDQEGNYTINVPDQNSILVFTYIGFGTKEMAVGQQTLINAILEAKNTALNEVVVTAFGISRERKSLTYSVSEVKGEDFTQSRELNVANALSGKVAGVNATGMASGPGGSSRVIIRGSGSLSGDNQPLYVVNGMPISNNPRTIKDQANGATTDLGDGISSINPDDIESISVLKGGAAAALYGSQAANGVILITTKKGMARKGIGVDVNSNFTVGTIHIFPDYQYEYGQGTLGVKPTSQSNALSTGRLSFGAKMDGQPTVQFDGIERPYSPVYVKDNIKNFYRPSTNWVNTVAFSGGSESINYRVSLSDLEATSVQPGSGYKRRTANVSLRANLSSKLSVESTMQYTYDEGKNRPGLDYVGTNAAWGVYLLANTVDIRTLAPGYDPETFREIEWQHVNQATNPYFAINRMGNSDSRNRLIAQGSVTYNILPNLFIKGDVMRDFENWEQEDFMPIGTAFRPQGNFRALTQDLARTNGRVIINYDLPATGNFGASAMVGGNIERFENASTSHVGSEFIVPDWISYANLAVLNTSAGLITSGSQSLFASADLSYKEMIYLTLTGRKDWFSTLNPGNNSIFYPSIGGSILLSQALKLPKAINLAKIRASWAQVGSATVSPYAINQTYSFREGGHMGVPVQTTSSALSNLNLRPLTSTTLEFGIDLEFNDGRFGLDFTVYDRLTTDDIVSTSLAPSSGATSTILNAGEISNKGVEVLVFAEPVKTNDFNWRVSYNLGYNKNRVLALAPGQPTGGTSLLGRDLSTAFGYDFATTEDGTRIYNSASKYEVRSEVLAIGPGVPPYTMGLENTFTYKDFSLNVLIDAKFGNYFYSQNHRYMHRFGLTKETLPGRENGLTVEGVDEKGNPFTHTWPASHMATYYNNQGQYTKLFHDNGSFIKLRGLVLSYNLPVKKLKFVNVSSAQLSFVARNLAILYKRLDHFDPEQGFRPTDNKQNATGVMLPRTRDLGLNLSVKF